MSPCFLRPLNLQRRHWVRPLLLPDLGSSLPSSPLLSLGPTYNSYTTTYTLTLLVSLRFQKRDLLPFQQPRGLCLFGVHLVQFTLNGWSEGPPIPLIPRYIVQILCQLLTSRRRPSLGPSLSKISIVTPTHVSFLQTSNLRAVLYQSPRVRELTAWYDVETSVKGVAILP